MEMTVLSLSVYLSLLSPYIISVVLSFSLSLYIYLCLSSPFVSYVCLSIYFCISLSICSSLFLFVFYPFK